MDQNFLTYISEAIDQYRADKRQKQAAQVQPTQEATSQKPARLSRLVRWFLPNGGTLLIVLLLIATQSVWSLPLQSPNATSTSTISYQGRLANAAGEPVTDLYNMEFRIYDVPDGGTPLWEEYWTGGNSVQVSDGLFNVMLGSIDNTLANAIAGHDELYLGITVGTDSQMSPRVQLGSVPFSFQAQEALTVSDGSITTAKIEDGAVTTAKIADGAVGGSEIANDAVGSSKIAANAVESSQIADNAVGSSQIADGAVTVEKLNLASAHQLVRDASTTIPGHPGIAVGGLQITLTSPGKIFTECDMTVRSTSDPIRYVGLKSVAKKGETTIDAGDYAYAGTGENHHYTSWSVASILELPEAGDWTIQCNLHRYVGGSHLSDPVVHTYSITAFQID